MLGEYVTKTKILKICQKSIIISKIAIEVLHGSENG